MKSSVKLNKDLAKVKQLHSIRRLTTISTVNCPDFVQVSPRARAVVLALGVLSAGSGLA